MTPRSPHKQGTRSKRVKVSLKNPKNIGNMLKFLEKWLSYKLRGFDWFWNFFWFCLAISVLEELKKSIFEMPIIIQNLNFNNLRTTSAKSIDLHTIRRLVECSLKNDWQKQCWFLCFIRYCYMNVGWYCDLPSSTQGTKALKFQ